MPQDLAKSTETLRRAQAAHAGELKKLKAAHDEAIDRDRAQFRKECEARFENQRCFSLQETDDVD